MQSATTRMQEILKMSDLLPSTVNGKGKDNKQEGRTTILMSHYAL